MTFLLSRRWVLFAVAVAALALGCYRLGVWQFHRLAETKAENAVIEHNLRADPVPVDRVLAVGTPVAADEQWRRVRATGHYVEDHSVVVRYQTRDGRNGVDVVTPLMTGSGAAVLVDRGWLPTESPGSVHPDVPAPPGGTVTVVGWVRENATGDAAAVSNHSTRAVSSATIGPTLPFKVYGGFVDAQHEQPKPAHPLVRAELPDLGDGPHFFYGIQWWFFAGLAVFGFFYLAWDERKKRRAGPAGARDGAPTGAGGAPLPAQEEDPATRSGRDVRVEP